VGTVVGEVLFTGEEVDGEEVGENVIFLTTTSLTVTASPVALVVADTVVVLMESCTVLDIGVSAREKSN